MALLFKLMLFLIMDSNHQRGRCFLRVLLSGRLFICLYLRRPAQAYQKIFRLVEASIYLQSSAARALTAAN